MFAISRAEAYQVVGFNKDGTQMQLCFARSLPQLLRAWTKRVAWYEAMGPHNILPSFRKITVWNVDQGFTCLDLPYIPTV